MRGSIRYHLHKNYIINATKIVGIKCVVKELITFLGILVFRVSNRQSELVYAHVTGWQL